MTRSSLKTLVFPLLEDGPQHKNEKRLFIHHWQTQCEKPETLTPKELTELIMRTDLKDNLGATPLHYLLFYSDKSVATSVFNFLRSNFALTKCKDDAGRNIIHYFLAGCTAESFVMLQSDFFPLMYEDDKNEMTYIDYLACNQDPIIIASVLNNTKESENPLVAPENWTRLWATLGKYGTLETTTEGFYFLSENRDIADKISARIFYSYININIHTEVITALIMGKAPFNDPKLFAPHARNNHIWYFIASHATEQTITNVLKTTPCEAIKKTIHIENDDEFLFPHLLAYFKADDPSFIEKIVRGIPPFNHPMLLLKNKKNQSLWHALFKYASVSTLQKVNMLLQENKFSSEMKALFSEAKSSFYELLLSNGRAEIVREVLIRNAKAFSAFHQECYINGMDMWSTFLKVAPLHLLISLMKCGTTGSWQNLIIRCSVQQFRNLLEDTDCKNQLLSCLHQEPTAIRDILLQKPSPDFLKAIFSDHSLFAEIKKSLLNPDAFFSWIVFAKKISLLGQIEVFNLLSNAQITTLFSSVSLLVKETFCIQLAKNDDPLLITPFLSGQRPFDRLIAQLPPVCLEKYILELLRDINPLKIKCILEATPVEKIKHFISELDIRLLPLNQIPVVLTHPLSEEMEKQFSTFWEKLLKISDPKSILNALEIDLSDSMKRLLKKKNKNNEDLRHFLSRNQNPIIIALILLSKKISPFIQERLSEKESNGETFAHLLAQNASSEILSKVVSLDVFSDLFLTIFKEKNIENETFLHALAKSGNPDPFLEMLKKEKIPLPMQPIFHEKDKNGNTFLHMLAENSKIPFEKLKKIFLHSLTKNLLVEKNIKNKTLLHFLCAKSNLDTTEEKLLRFLVKLKKSGVLPEDKDSDGNTALHIAIKYKNIPMAIALIKSMNPLQLVETFIASSSVLAYAVQQGKDFLKLVEPICLQLKAYLEHSNATDAEKRNVIEKIKAAYEVSKKSEFRGTQYDKVKNQLESLLPETQIKAMEPKKTDNASFEKQKTIQLASSQKEIIDFLEKALGTSLFRFNENDILEVTSERKKTCLIKMLNDINMTLDHQQYDTQKNWTQKDFSMLIGLKSIEKIQEAFGLSSFTQAAEHFKLKSTLVFYLLPLLEKSIENILTQHFEKKEKRHAFALSFDPETHHILLELSSDFTETEKKQLWDAFSNENIENQNDLFNIKIEKSKVSFAFSEKRNLLQAEMVIANFEKTLGENIAFQKKLHEEANYLNDATDFLQEQNADPLFKVAKNELAFTYTNAKKIYLNLLLGEIESQKEKNYRFYVDNINKTLVFDPFIDSLTLAINDFDSTLRFTFEYVAYQKEKLSFTISGNHSSFFNYLENFFDDSAKLDSSSESITFSVLVSNLDGFIWAFIDAKEQFDQRIKDAKLTMVQPTSLKEDANSFDKSKVYKKSDSSQQLIMKLNSPEIKLLLSLLAKHPLDKSTPHRNRELAMLILKFIIEVYERHLENGHRHSPLVCLRGAAAHLLCFYIYKNISHINLEGMRLYILSLSEDVSLESFITNTKCFLNLFPSGTSNSFYDFFARREHIIKNLSPAGALQLFIDEKSILLNKENPPSELTFEFSVYLLGEALAVLKQLPELQKEEIIHFLVACSLFRNKIAHPPALENAFERQNIREKKQTLETLLQQDALKNFSPNSLRFLSPSPPTGEENNGNPALTSSSPVKFFFWEDGKSSLPKNKQEEKETQSGPYNR